MSSDLRRLVRYIRPYRLSLIAGVACILGYVAFSVTVPLIVGRAIDQNWTVVTWGKLTLAALKILGASATGGLFLFLQRRILIGMSRHVEYDLRNDFYAHLVDQPLSFFHEHRTGDLMARATNDLAAVRQLAGPVIMYSLQTVFAVVVILPIMFIINWKLTLLLFVTMPLVSLTVKIFGQQVHTRFEKIQDFFAQDARISVGLLVDLSSSMGNKIDAVHQAVDEFFKYANPDDDYFVITFADRPKLIADTTQSIETVQSKLAGVPAKGNTALADAIYMGVAKLRSARYTRKALVIISDGGDNNSRHGLRQTKNMVRESDAQVYAIDVCDAPALLVTKKLEERFGRQWLTEVTESTGGRTIVVDDASKIPEAAARTSLELRNQYVLGYHPEHPTHDGKWRKIKVRVSRPDPALPLQVYYRTGYVERRD